MVLLQAGRGLASYSSVEIHSIAAYLMLEVGSKRTKEEAEARDSVLSRVRAIDREFETGMPSVTQLFRPANEMYEGR